MLEENKKEAFRLFLDYIFNDTTEEEIKEFTRTEIMIRDVGIKVMELNKKLDALIENNNNNVYINGEPVGKVTDVKIKPAPANIMTKIADLVSIGNIDNIEPKETKKYYNRSRRTNTTGFYRVSYNKTSRRWGYYYKNNECKQSSISSKDLNELKEKVKAKGLEWEIIDREKAKKSYEKNELLKKDAEKKNKQSKGAGVRRKIKENPDEVFDFKKSYKKNTQYKIRNDGIICNNYQEKRELCYPHQLLRLFEMVKKFPIKNNNIYELKKYGETFASRKTVMELLYSINSQMQSGSGDKIELIYECYENEQHSNPIFKNINKEIRINDVGTGLSPFTVSNWITEINDSYNPKFAIVKLIHDNIQNGCTRKELVTLLFNYENPALLKTLKGGM